SRRSVPDVYRRSVCGARVPGRTTRASQDQVDDDVQEMRVCVTVRSSMTYRRVTCHMLHSLHQRRALKDLVVDFDRATQTRLTRNTRVSSR
ncbi:Uncharacterized protein DAT39_005680, partial [Clarias magur]